jgi:hypothetical protein
MEVELGREVRGKWLGERGMWRGERSVVTGK